MGEITADDVSKFVKPKETAEDYYLKVFQKYKESGKLFRFTTFNWPAFLFVELWFVYRKMYLYGAMALVIHFILPFFIPEYIFGSSILDFIPLILIRIIAGFVGTPLYIKFAEKKITAGRRGSGTSPVAVFFLLLVEFFLGFSLVGIHNC